MRSHTLQGTRAQLCGTAEQGSRGHGNVAWTRRPRRDGTSSQGGLLMALLTACSRLGRQGRGGYGCRLPRQDSRDVLSEESCDRWQARVGWAGWKGLVFASGRQGQSTGYVRTSSCRCVTAVYSIDCDRHPGWREWGRCDGLPIARVRARQSRTCKKPGQGGAVEASPGSLSAAHC